MTQGPGKSASNDFRPFKNYTDLKDTLKTLKRYRNEVSYTINIENVGYINVGYMIKNMVIEPVITQLGL